MTTTTRLDDFISTLINIGIVGVEIAITILAITLGLLAIPKVPNVENIEIIGMTGGFLLAGWIFYMVIDVFRFSRKVEVGKVFWVTAFIVGGAMITQYIAEPFASISVPTILTLALVMAAPAWVNHFVEEISEKLEQRIKQSDEKRKNEANGQRLIAGNEPDGITPEELTLLARIEALELQQQRLV